MGGWGLSGGEWGITLGGWGWVGHYFLWEKILVGWEWVGMSGGECVHCLIMPFSFIFFSVKKVLFQ